jgi:pre-rRNA-processing protein TSR4
MSPSSPAGSSSSTLPISNTLLALPDGPIPADHADRKSYTISYIGGYPSFPDTLDVPKEVTCGSCHSPIPLLAQVYCPPDGGENDRTVYVWGCSKRKCQRKEGCIRAFRASRRNEAYAKDVEEKRAAAEAEAEAARAKAKINPFTVS